jgi:hypothetical protein
MGLHYGGVFMTIMQIILGGCLILSALLMAGYAGWRLWTWTGDAAEMLEKHAGKPKHGDSE